MSEEWVIITIVILYAAIGLFVVMDVYFDFRLSYHIRKIFGK